MSSDRVALQGLVDNLYNPSADKNNVEQFEEAILSADSRLFDLLCLSLLAEDDSDEMYSAVELLSQHRHNEVFVQSLSKHLIRGE